jgi:hypothetical protein
MADRNRRFTVASIALPFLFLVMSRLASASTLTVINTNDTGVGSLRGEILAASSGDTINFNVSGTITLGSTLSGIAINLTIDGSGQSITVDGANSFHILIVNTGATLTLHNLTIAKGFGIEGGGILNHGTLTVTNTTFSGNSASGSGGGIDNFGALTVANSTFFGNSAQLSGGIDNVGAQTVTNSTFSDNSAVVGGGGINNEPLGSTTLKGTILAAEPGGNCGGLITDGGYNISDDVSCPIASGTSVDGSTTLNLDPLGLANNGGPTQTIALEPNSEAVDFIPIGKCTDQSSPTPQPLTTDQRGFPRPDPGNPDFCYAGAFELQTTPIVIERNGERLQIVHSTNPSGNQLNTAFTFIENGFPACDEADDAFNGIVVIFSTGSCAAPGSSILILPGDGFTVHTVNHQTYGTFFFAASPFTISARMVALPKPSAPACGEWTMNLELTAIDLTSFGDGPFALTLFNADGDEGCLDITNAIVGSQTPRPPHGVRRRVRRQ